MKLIIEKIKHWWIARKERGAAKRESEEYYYGRLRERREELGHTMSTKTVYMGYGGVQFETIWTDKDGNDVTYHNVFP
jgi:hypothetical protein